MEVKFVQTFVLYGNGGGGGGGRGAGAKSNFFSA